MPKTLDDVVLAVTFPLIDVSTDGKKIVAMEPWRKNLLIVRSLETGKILAECEADRMDRSRGQFLAFAGQNNNRVLRGNVGKLMAWKVNEPFWEPFFEPRARRGKDFVWLTVSRSGRFLIGYHGGPSGALTVFDLTAPRPPILIAYPTQQGTDATCGRISPDDRYCYLGHASGTVRRLQLATGIVETVIPTSEARVGDVTGLTLSPEGKRLAWTNRGEETIHIYEVGGKPFSLASTNKFHPSGIGATWTYKDVATNNNSAKFRRVTVEALEVLGPYRCYMVKFETRTQQGWSPLGVIWYTASAKGVGRLGNRTYDETQAKPRIAFESPILEIPPIEGDATSGDEESIKWVNSERSSGTRTTDRWKARKEPAKVSIYGVPREVIAVERRNEDRRVTVNRYAEGIGLFESRTSDTKTELVEYRAAP